MRSSDIQEFNLNREVVRVVLRSIRDKPGVAGELCSALTEKGVEILGISYDTSTKGRGDIGFAVLKSQKDIAGDVCEEVLAGAACEFYSIHEDVAMLTFRINPSKDASMVVSEIFEVLAQNGVNIDMISYSKGVLSLMVKIYRLDDAIEAFQDMGIVPEIGV
ncbi:MAG: ACT domain-containing protein [candidate division WOR-3 bacterium]